MFTGAKNRTRSHHRCRAKQSRRYAFIEGLEHRIAFSVTSIDYGSVRNLVGTSGLSYLENTDSDAGDELRFQFGVGGDTAFAGDWNRDGFDDAGTVRPHASGSLQWLLDLDRDGGEESRFFFGLFGDLPQVGDFNGDGYEDVAVVRPVGPNDPVVGLPTYTWFIAHGPFPEISSPFTDSVAGVSQTTVWGFRGDTPVVGDWDGNGTDEPGIVSQTPVIVNGQSLARWFVPENGTIMTWEFGFPSDKFVVGDWDGNGTDNAGAVRERAGTTSLWLADTDRDVFEEYAFDYGFQGDQYVVGKWKRDTTGPTAAAVTSPVTQSASSYDFSVVYADDVFVDPLTLDSQDVHVEGPNGFNQPVILVGSNTQLVGTTQSATYRLQAPGGQWKFTDSGLYQIVANANQISDLSGNNLAPVVIGQFSVSLADTIPPTATVQLGHLSSAFPTNDIVVRYDDNVAIDVSDVDDSDIRVEGPNGFSGFARLLSIDNSNDGSPRSVTYRVTGPNGEFSFAGNGVYRVFLQNGQVSDTSGNFVAGQLLGEFFVQIPPRPTLYLAVDGYSISRDALVRWSRDWSYAPEGCIDPNQNGVEVRPFLEGRRERSQIISKLVNLLQQDLNPFGIKVEFLPSNAPVVEGVGATTLFLGKSTVSLLGGCSSHIAGDIDVDGLNLTDIGFVGNEDWGTADRTAVALADVALHEAGHTYGLYHVVSGNQPESMGLRYNRPATEWVQNTTFLDQSFSIFPNHGPVGSQNSYRVTLSHYPTGVSSTDVALDLILPGDTDSDGDVDVVDLATLTQHFGSLGSLSSGDFTGDGRVDGVDYSRLLEYFGFSPTYLPLHPEDPKPEDPVPSGQQWLDGLQFLDGLARQELLAPAIDRLCSAYVQHDAIADLNGDGSLSELDLDAMRAAASLSVGDSNFDGQFTSDDLVQVFQRGKYEDAAEAVWSDGDWNCDGRFDSTDLVAAFQAGGYR